jgi:hypothetical protein
MLGVDLVCKSHLMQLGLRFSAMALCRSANMFAVFVQLLISPHFTTCMWPVVHGSKSFVSESYRALSGKPWAYDASFPLRDAPERPVYLKDPSNPSGCYTVVFDCSGLG